MSDSKSLPSREKEQRRMARLTSIFGKERSPVGESDVALSIRNSSGAKISYLGRLSDAHIGKLLSLALELQSESKVGKD